MRAQQAPHSYHQVSAYRSNNSNNLLRRQVSRLRLRQRLRISSIRPHRRHRLVSRGILRKGMVVIRTGGDLQILVGWMDWDWRAVD